MSYGDRKADRVRFEHRYPMNLMGVDGTWRRSCVLLDVSATGARLEVEGALDVLRAQEFFLVLSSKDGRLRRVHVSLDGRPVGAAQAGADVHRCAVTVRGQRLYQLVRLRATQDHVLTLRFDPDVSGYAFTFR